jgi:hypothetical protein
MRSLLFYNLSIKKSIFSDDFKIAIIKPLFKGGDRRYKSNYRKILIYYLKINLVLEKG